MMWLMVVAPASLQATPVHWHNQNVRIVVEGQDLKEVLRDVCASQGVVVSIASNVTGTVSGRFDMPAQKLLDTLAATFGFVWFYDGSVISISNANDVTRQVIKFSYASPTDLNATLRNMNMDDPRFPIVYDTRSGTAMVNGPPQYVQEVTELANRIDEAAIRDTGSVVRVFRLKNAWAADRKLTTDGNTLTVPGVATLLSNLYHPQGSQGHSAKSSGGANIQAMTSKLDVMNMSPAALTGGSSAPMPPLPPGPPFGNGSPADSGSSGWGGGAGSRAAGAGGLTTSPAATDAPPGGGDLSLPVMQADEATNSVLIRDSAEHMAQYASLIDQLDVRPRIIEISAHIIEIDDDLLTQIGVDWRASNSHLDFETGTGSTAQNVYNGSIQSNFGQTTLPGSVLANATPVGGVLTAVVGNAGRYLMARVSALNNTTLAKIDATPKVATLDNVEAVMNSKQQFFVPVTGYTSASLYSVSAGVSLRVRPMTVVDADGQTHIKLTVHIEDGSITSATVDNLPVVDTSEIDTEAMVGQGESLLIAGYASSNDTRSTTGIPLLSKIPLIGALFRYNNNSKTHMERVYLLSPRVLDL